MRSSLGRAIAAAAGLMTLLAPTAASASWWDGGYSPARRHSPPPEKNPPPDSNRAPGESPPSDYNSPPAPAPAPAPPPPPVGPVASIYGCENSTLPGTERLLHKETTPPTLAELEAASGPLPRWDSERNAPVLGTPEP